VWFKSDYFDGVPLFIWDKSFDAVIDHFFGSALYIITLLN
jgi:hypothetical protein